MLAQAAQHGPSLPLPGRWEPHQRRLLVQAAAAAAAAQEKHGGCSVHCQASEEL